MLKTGEVLSVLIVDDEEAIRETLKEFIELMDIFSFVVLAENGADAVRKCQYQHFDLVITDLQMPMLKGFDLIHKIKDDERRVKLECPTSIIVLSANLTGIEVKKVMSLGVKHFMTKPCEAPEFIEKVTNILVKERSQKIKVKKSA